MRSQLYMVLFLALAQGNILDKLSLSAQSSIVHVPYDNEAFPSEGPYYEGSMIYNAEYLSRPRAVIKVGSVEDVQKAVRFLNNHSLPFRIHSSGHNLAGYSGASCAQYLVDLSGLGVTPKRNTDGTTTFGPGVRSSALFQFLKPYREVVVSCEPSLHALGMILVGGISELSTVQGISADLVQELEVVVADGSVVTASATKNSDLFYALRGAGSNSLGIVTSATIRAIPVPANMGKGKFVFNGASEEGIQKFLRAYRDEVVMSKRSGVADEMGTYLTLQATANGRDFLLDWTYFGNTMTKAVKDLHAWVDKTAKSSGLNNFTSTHNVATYDEFVEKYVGKVKRTDNPEQWFSSFASTVSDNLLESLASLTTKAVNDGAHYATILILPMHTNANTVPTMEKIGGKGKLAKGKRLVRDHNSAFSFRAANFWFLDISGCNYSDVEENSPCREFVRGLYTASKRDRGYLGLYHGVQNRFVESQPDFLNDYFLQTSNPQGWNKLMAAKQKYDPTNRFCTPQSIIPCVAPSADRCVARGPLP